IDAISSARLMVLVFSSHSNSSPQVRREVERAVHKQLPVLPFRLEDIVPSKSLEYFLSSQHWLDGFPPPREPHYERLCALVAARVNAAASPLAAPSPATPAAMAAVPAGAFSAQQLQSLERQLADHIGPLAQHLVKRAAAQAPDWERLIARLSGEIDSDAARQRFLHACRTLPRPKP
ncbi:MAG TPA: TIR domain-containing protein, partial [Steroidobacteraceae bacterium]|nr:TIR domain-containing protein [Steroidobacteraceae bacterium]